MKNLEKLNNFCAIFVFCIVSLFVFSQGTKAAEIQIPDNVSLYQTLQDVPVKNGNQLLATVKKNSYLYLEQPADTTLYMQFGATKLRVDAASFSKIDNTENMEVPDYFAVKSDVNQFVVFKESITTGMDISKVPVVDFTTDGSYPIFQQSDSSYDVLIGNRIVSINKATGDVSTNTDSQISDTSPTIKSVTVPQTEKTAATVSLPSSDSSNLATNPFQGTEKYLKTQSSSVPVYRDSNGKIKVGELKASQEYVIVSQLDGWLKVKFGNTVGFVQKTAVVPGDGRSIKNLNKGEPNSSWTFKTYQSLSIYDNSSGSFVEFGKLDNDVEYPIIRQYSANWLEIDFAGRIGYVYKPYVQLAVTQNDRFFKPFQKETPIYINQGGTNVYVGNLDLNQEYPINGFISGFVRIKYGNGYAYVRDNLLGSSSGSTINNLNKTYVNSGKLFRTYRTLQVYDTTSGKSVEFAALTEGQYYPYIKQTSENWMMVDVGGRYGYIYIPHTIAPLKQTDKFFKTVYANTPVTVNDSNHPNVGELKGGQEFPIIGQIPNFVKIQYGNSYAYVRTAYVSASTGKSIKNISTGKSTTVRQLTASINVPIYDNTSGSMVEFAHLSPGTSYPIIQETSEYWVKINFGGRTGYVYKPRTSIDFKSTDQFFQPLESDVPLYIDKNGVKVMAATLKSEQKYRINSQISSYIRIMYGNGYGYVKTVDVYPADGTGAYTFDSGLKNSYEKMKNDQVIKIYNNANSTSPVIATLEPGQEYPVIEQTSSDWLKISIAGRIGYVYKPSVSTGTIKVYLSTNYNISFGDMFEKQWTTGPQTDKDYDTYVSSTYITLDKSNSSIGYVNEGPLNVRGGPDSGYWIVAKLAAGTKVSILGKTGDWYQIKYSVTWKNASPDDIRYNLNPNNVTKDSSYYYQFLKLSESAGLDVDEVNAKVLAGKGILANKAKAFIDAALTNHVNEVYLISHALLETGNGTSNLAKGILVSTIDGKPVTPKVVYNMFGIGAYDSCAEQCGAETAYKQGWFTPDAAIIGGAKFIGSSYINDPNYHQDTLYKMKWNPAVPATHQYATDIGWAYKQTFQISQIYSLLDNYQITYDVPVFLP